MSPHVLFGRREHRDRRSTAYGHAKSQTLAPFSYYLSLLLICQAEQIDGSLQENFDFSFDSFEAFFGGEVLGLMLFLEFSKLFDDVANFCSNLVSDAGGSVSF